MAGRSANRALVVGALAEVIAGGDAAEWERRLVPLGIVAAAVTTLEKALGGEQVRARGMVVDIALADGTLRAAGNPIRAGDAGPHRPPPLLGEHNHLLADGVPV
jgi:crotonobetainyl-CoA:carnitine CoA-transferase CaiB-like acyl-CoA transferase